MAVVSTFPNPETTVTMYMRDKEQANSINEKHINSKRFTDTELPHRITATNKFEATKRSFIR